MGTGTPAYIEDYLLAVGSHTPPVALTPGITEYMAYIFTALRDVHPELGIDGILTEQGRHWLARAEVACAIPFEHELEGINFGDWFTAPVATLPNFRQTTVRYLGMPETGFDKPFFIGHGVQDTDVPFPLTAAYVAVLEANGQPVECHPYPTGNHNTTLALSLPDSIPFVKRLFR